MNDDAPVLFIGDAHLRGPTDPHQSILVDFLNRHADSGWGVIVLGDLFDFFAGPNKTAAKAYQPVLEALARFKPFHYLEGNHDFDLDHEFLGWAKSSLHPQPIELKLHGCNFYLLHGDRASPSDWGTKILRRCLQSSIIRLTRDNLLTDNFIFNFALKFATFSRKSTWPGRSDEHSAAHQKSINILSDHNVDAVIYGHTHKPILKQYEQGIVGNPGATIPGGNYLSLQEQNLILHQYPDGKTKSSLKLWIENNGHGNCPAK
jgi:UDP-2,3-diacylglucosamine hydrolase